ncbi:hypothetical protein ES703_116464 [subsurface metagenome]
MSEMRVNSTFMYNINPIVARPSTIPSVRATNPIPVAILTASISFTARAIKSPVLTLQ